MHVLDYYKKWKSAPEVAIQEEITKENARRQAVLGYWSKQDCMENIKILQRILKQRNEVHQDSFLGADI